jgi:hypothetical protein
MAVSQDIQEKVLEEAYSVTPNYDINYNDPRFGKVESAKGQALTELEQTYAGMIGQSDQYYNAQIQATQDWAAKQQQLQQDRTDFAIEQINQQKEQANKDYLKEQSGAYVDWQKQSNKYGTNAEQMASAGLTGTGFAESSQVSMYNTYQNRVAAARESYNQAVLNYNNAIKDAMLQNNEALAQIAYESLQKSLELSLAGFQYKNQLILEQSNKKIELDNMYYNRYQDVLQQINHENAIKEDIRQYNETQKWQTEQAELGREHDKAMADIEYQYQVKRDEATRTFQSAQAELDRKHDLALVKANTAAAKEKADHEHELAMKQLAQQHQNDLAKIDKQLASEKALLEYKDSLEDKPISYVTGGNTKSKSFTTAGKDAFINRVTNNPRTTKTTFNGSTYNEAVSYMKSKGVSTAGVLTASEWSRRKSSYSMTGIGNAAVKNYKSYAEYLRAYVNSTVANK